ncbi:unnamed protein product [Clonostachys byssicola]|uniref:Uncharacterized protein n=1 Tax=Clonostachys byssicola TaxID=160290 RepID=A0A9N9UND8_9HYPO|nr:unnamed protein product [Clonostachys byssicola]
MAPRRLFPRLSPATQGTLRRFCTLLQHFLTCFVPDLGEMERNSNNLTIHSLPLADSEIAEVAAWLETQDANFQCVENFQICQNTAQLAKVCNTLVKEIMKNTEPSPSQNRVSAMKFDRPAVVPTQDGWIVDVIPVKVTEGSVKIADQPLAVGQYARLAKSVEVTGDFFAVLLLSELAK